MQIRLLGPPRGAPEGRCRLCGWEGRLDDTHIPPKRAGNRNVVRAPISRTGSNGIAMLGHSKWGAGGIRGYWFCRQCNGATGRWDQQYVAIQRQIALRLHDARNRRRLTGAFGELDIGAVARSMWAWAFALVPDLVRELPEVAESVRTGEPVDPPGEFQLLLAVTRSLRLWVSSQPQAVIAHIPTHKIHPRPSGLLVRGPLVEPSPTMVVQSPPFNVLLARMGHPGVPHVQINDWLLDAAGQRRRVAVDVPLIQVLDEGAPIPVSYRQFAQDLAG
jgi:hypothetical protein